MLQVRHSVHLNFDRYGDLLFHFFRRAAWPLGDDLDVVVGYVWIGFHRKVVKREGAPEEQENCKRQDDEAVVERVADKSANHRIVLKYIRRTLTYCSTVFCKTRALLTSCWPVCIPHTISCVLSGSEVPATSSVRQNFLSPAGI